MTKPTGLNGLRHGKVSVLPTSPYRQDGFGLSERETSSYFRPAKMGGE
jgi:hypothetical protein